MIKIRSIQIIFWNKIWTSYFLQILTAEYDTVFHRASINDLGLLLLIWINPLRAKFFRENINIYLHFMSFLHINKTQVIEIPPWVKQGPAYST